MKLNSAARSKIIVGGEFVAEHWRHRRLLGLPGEGRILIARVRTRNIVVNQGLNYLLNVGIAGTGQISPWFVATFEGNYTPLATDTAATFPGSAIECTAYDEVSRPEYIEVVSTLQSITNLASRATFTYNDTKTIYGASLHSVATKAAITGSMLAAARFATPRPVVATDQLLVAYTINAASA